MVMWYWLADARNLFWQLSINHDTDAQDVAMVMELLSYFS